MTVTDALDEETVIVFPIFYALTDSQYRLSLDSITDLRNAHVPDRIIESAYTVKLKVDTNGVRSQTPDICALAYPMDAAGEFREWPSATTVSVSQSA